MDPYLAAATEYLKGDDAQKMYNFLFEDAHLTVNDSRLHEFVD